MHTHLIRVYNLSIDSSHLPSWTSRPPKQRLMNLCGTHGGDVTGSFLAGGGRGALGSAGLEALHFCCVCFFFNTQ